MAAGDLMRVAIVGYGRIAPKHIEVFRELGCEVTAAVNRSDEGRERARTEGGIEQTYARIDEMLERESPDAVVACPSVVSVFDVARELIQARVPTLLEKPPGTSLAELDELIRLSGEQGSRIAVGMNRRYYSVLRKAIDDAGGLDAITTVSVEWSEDPAHLLKRFPPEVVEKMIFGNSLHGLDLLTFLAGEVPEPHIVSQRLAGEFRWNMALLGASCRGVTAVFASTWDSPAGWRLTFTAPGKRYVLAPLESCLVYEAGRWEPRVIEPDDEDRRFKPGFFGQAREFLSAVAGKPAQAASLEAVRPSLSLAETLTAWFVA